MKRNGNKALVTCVSPTCRHPLFPLSPSRHPYCLPLPIQSVPLRGVCVRERGMSNKNSWINYAGKTSEGDQDKGEGRKEEGGENKENKLLNSQRRFVLIVVNPKELVYHN